MRKLSPAEYDRMARRSRSFYDTANAVQMMQLEQQIKLEQVRQIKLEQVRMSTMNWLTPILAGDGVISGIDFGRGDEVTTKLTPIPPPKRYRRNT